jgi:RNA polymerase sigma-70 factor (ECF subfamily)
MQDETWKSRMTAPTKEQRFQAMVLPHLNSAFNLARWLTRSQPDAEDVVQEAYLRAFKFFDSFHGEDGRAWLLGIVRNTFYTWYQQNKTQAQSTLFEEELHSIKSDNYATAQSADNNPESLLIQKDSQRQMQHALESLSVEFREVMVMREVEDLSYKQIAGIIGIPIGTVMSRLGRGRKQLAEILSSTNRDA